MLAVNEGSYCIAAESKKHIRDESKVKRSLLENYIYIYILFMFSINAVEFIACLRCADRSSLFYTFCVLYFFQVPLFHSLVVTRLRIQLILALFFSSLFILYFSKRSKTNFYLWSYIIDMSLIRDCTYHDFCTAINITMRSLFSLTSYYL